MEQPNSSILSYNLIKNAILKEDMETIFETILMTSELYGDYDDDPSYRAMTSFRRNSNILFPYISWLINNVRRTNAR